MNILTFIQYLNKKNGWNLDGSHYAQIAEWKQWWQGYYEKFHKRVETGLDGKKHARAMYSLRMPKQVCEDWATLLLNDKTTLTIENSKSSKFLVGGTNAQQLGGLIGQLDFWTNANRLVENAFRSGTGAFVMGAEGIELAGDSIAAGKGSLYLDYLPGECILPLTIRHGKIVEVAFVSEVTEKGKSCVYLQTHKLAEDHYVIENQYFTSDNADSGDAAYQEAQLPSGMAKTVHTGSNVPWFAVFTPAGVKSTGGAPGMGAAIFNEAMDAVKQADLAFDNYCMDIYLGGKKVFYNRNLLQSTIDKDGNEHTITPDDIRQQLFVKATGGDIDEKADWHEYNPDLRTEDNSRAVQDALDYVSFKVGLGTHHYQFNSGNIATATQYVGDRQDMIQHAQRHHTRIEAALVQILRALLWGGKNILGADVDPDTSITINWDDSYITDSATRRAQDESDAMNGFIPKYRYNMEWRGMSEEDARKAVQEAQEEVGGTGDMDLFGGA